MSVSYAILFTQYNIDHTAFGEIWFVKTDVRLICPCYRVVVLLIIPKIDRHTHTYKYLNLLNSTKSVTKRSILIMTIGAFCSLLCTLYVTVRGEQIFGTLQSAAQIHFNMINYPIHFNIFFFMKMLIFYSTVTSYLFLSVCP